MVSVFWLEPYLGQKWLILVVFGVFTWNQWSKYGLYRYIYDRHDLTDAVEQKFFLITNYADLDHHYSFSLKISQIRSDHLIFPFSKNEPVPIPFPPKMIYIVIWSRLFYIVQYSMDMSLSYHNINCQYLPWDYLF